MLKSLVDNFITLSKKIKLKKIQLYLFSNVLQKTSRALFNAQTNNRKGHTLQICVDNEIKCLNVIVRSQSINRKQFFLKNSFL